MKHFLSLVFSLVVILSNYLVQFTLNDWLTYGAILFPIGFLLTDILSERKGKEYVKTVIRQGILISIIPTILFVDYRITAASLIAYFISQNIDVSIFSYLKEKFNKQWWLRNNVSTIISQTVDSFAFFFIAFYGVMPISQLVTLSIGALGLKIFMSIIDTPFFYYFGIRK